jgi:hypothetical protein
MDEIKEEIEMFVCALYQNALRRRYWKEGKIPERKWEFQLIAYQTTPKL